MLNKLIKLFALILMPLVLYLIFSGFSKSECSINTNLNINYLSPPSDSSKNFINMIFGSQHTDDFEPVFIYHFLPRIKNELYFDYVHNYSKGWSKYGNFGKSLTGTQIDNISALFDSMRVNNLKLLTSGVNIDHMCYAQRMIYEVPAYSGDITTNYGFCYQNYRGVLENDNGKTVLHACPDNCPNQENNTPGYILENIYENLQFGDLFDFTQNDKGNWYIKPVMKIQTGLNPETEIVRIDVVNFKGNTILQVPIKAENFGQNYDGGYVETYEFSSGNPLFVKGKYDQDSNGLNEGVNLVPWWKWDDSCKIDFKIWWYGNAEVWIDRVNVDDEIGNDIFKGKHDNVIIEEAKLFGSDTVNYAFFTDELPHSNYAPARYVDSLIRAANPDSKFHVALSNYHQTRGYKNNNLGYKAFFENVKPLSFNCDAHEIFKTRIPKQFDNVNSEIPESWKSDNDEMYNREIQIHSFGDKNAKSPEDDWNVQSNNNDPKPSPWGSLVYQVTLAREQRDLYAPNTKLIMQPQLHAYATFDDSTNMYVDNYREPTNEEIQAQAMLCIAHGADGICWFIHPSIRWHKNGNLYATMIGLTDIFNVGDSESPGKRTSNLYGQNKFQYIADMNLKIKAWKPTLDKINWVSGYSVHSEGSTHEYIQILRSRNPDKSGNNPCVKDSNQSLPRGWYDCPDETYWEMGFFEPVVTSQTDYSRYFIMVNRRCVPYKAGTTIGDDRQLYVLFKSELPGNFNKWQVIDIENNNIIVSIVKGSNLYYDFGKFDPGEGKLYKIIPVTE